MKRNYKAWKNKQKEETNRKKVDDYNTIAISSDEDVVVLSIGEDECCHVADPYDEWVIDLAASYHVTPKRDFFTLYKVGNLGKVKMDNKSYTDIVGICDICVETNTKYTLKLKDVRHILDMCLNLIYVSVLDKKGYESHLGNGKWKLFKGSLVFARGKICCTLYKTQVKLCRDAVNATQMIPCLICGIGSWLI